MAKLCNGDATMTDPFYITSGSIAGSLQHLTPFIFIARFGVRCGENVPNCRENRKGLFTIGQIADSGGCPFIGVVLPVRFCKDEAVRRCFEELHHFLQTDTSGVSENEKRIQAQALLHDRLGGKVNIHDKTAMQGFIELVPDRSLFQLLCASFEYVDAIRDNPSGIAQPACLSAFQWLSYGEFLEWFYEHIPAAHWGWEHCYPFFVYDRTCPIGAFRSERDALGKPTLDLSKFFRLAPDILYCPIHVEFQLVGSRWIDLRLTSGAQSASISLSDGDSPLQALVEWLKMVDRGNIPVSASFDEEGVEVTLSAYNTDDLDQIFLRVIEQTHSEKVVMEGIFDKAIFAAAFRKALKIFLTANCRPNQQAQSEDGKIRDFTALKNAILADPWMHEDKSPLS